MSSISRVESMMPGFIVVQGTTARVNVADMALHSCIDDREVTNFWKSKKLTHGPKTQGATFGTAYIAAVARRYNQFNDSFFREFADKVSSVGRATPAVHDIDKMHCKHAQVVVKGGFGDSIDVNLTDPKEILENLEMVGGTQVHLAGDHNRKSVLRLNFGEGTTLVQERNGYTMDFWWAHGIMGIAQEALYQNLSKTLNALNVSTVEVYS